MYRLSVVEERIGRLLRFDRNPFLQTPQVVIVMLPWFQVFLVLLGDIFQVQFVDK
jgi:hypothetical protein